MDISNQITGEFAAVRTMVADDNDAPQMQKEAALAALTLLQIFMLDFHRLAQAMCKIAESK